MIRKIIFLGTRTVGRKCLEILLKQAAALDCEVVEVVTNQPANPYLAHGPKVADVAMDAGIPVKSRLETTGTPVHILLSVECEVVLTASQLARASEQAINLHMGPLPDYRGAGQCSFAILNGEVEFGTTLHLMVSKVDAGPILIRKIFPMHPDWNVQDLYENTVDESVRLFAENLPKMIRGQLKPILQSEFPDSCPRRFFKRSELSKYKKIEIGWSLEKIDRTVRAFDMPGHEPAYIQFQDRRLYMRTRDLVIVRDRLDAWHSLDWGSCDDENAP